MELLSQLPSSEIVDALLENYMRTFDQLFPLWYPSQFFEEMDAYRRDPGAVEYSWIAQLYMMLALSIRNLPETTFRMHAIEQDCESLSHIYLHAAQAAFKQIDYLSGNDLATLRALCIIVIGKLMNVVTANDQNENSLVMGMAVRMAMRMSMHRNPRRFSNMPKGEADSRSRIWVTLTLLDILTSLDSGLPTLVRTDDYEDVLEHGRAHLNHEDHEFCQNEAVDACDCSTLHLQGSRSHGMEMYQRLLSEIIPTVSNLINDFNSCRTSLKYGEVSDKDTMLRSALEAVARHSAPGVLSSTDDDSSHPRGLQQLILELLLRRTLMALHQPFARHPEQWELYKSSHWTVLECALALLKFHQSLSHRPALEWCMDLFLNNFSIAFIYVGLGIRRNDFSDSTDGFAETCPKEVAWTAMRNSTKIFHEFAGKSLNSYRAYMGAVYLVVALEALEKRTPMLQAMEVGGEHIVRNVHSQRERYLGSRCL